MIRLASATISSVRPFSRLEGLSASARFEPGGKIDALQPFPTGLTSIRNPLYSMVVIILCDVVSPGLTFSVLRGSTVVRMRRGANSVTSAVHRQHAADVPADPKMIRSRGKNGRHVAYKVSTRKPERSRPHSFRLLKRYRCLHTLGFQLWRSRKIQDPDHRSGSHLDCRAANLGHRLPYR